MGRTFRIVPSRPDLRYSSQPQRAQQDGVKCSLHMDRETGDGCG